VADYLPPVSTGGWLVFSGASCCGSICLCPQKWLDLFRVKTKMFYEGPSIDPLHFYLERLKLNTKGTKTVKTPKSFLGCNSAANSLDLLQPKCSTCQYLDCPTMGVDYLAVPCTADFVSCPFNSCRLYHARSRLNLLRQKV